MQSEPPIPLSKILWLVAKRLLCTAVLLYVTLLTLPLLPSSPPTNSTDTTSPP